MLQKQKLYIKAINNEETIIYDNIHRKVESLKKMAKKFWKKIK